MKKETKKAKQAGKIACKAENKATKEAQIVTQETKRKEKTATKKNTKSKKITDYFLERR